MFLTSFEDVKPGLRWSHARFGHETRWAQLYDGELDLLFDENELPSGIEKKKLEQLNYFRIVTDFYRRVLGGETLVSDPVLPMLTDAVDASVAWHSVKGYVVLLRRTGGRVEAVDPSHWVPVYDVADKSLVQGHVLGYPYYDGPERQDEYAVPNRIALVLVRGGGSRRVTYELDGQTLGRMVADQGEADAEAVVAWGNGESDYKLIEDAVSELIVREAGVSRILNKHSNPNLTGPRNGLVELVMPDGSVNYTFPSTDEGVFLPRNDAADPDYAYLVWDGSLEAATAKIERTKSFIREATGLPETSSESSGAMFAESGASRQVGLYKATSRVRRMRRVIEDLLKQLHPDIGTSWLLEPFENRSEREQATRENWLAGLLSQEEARSEIGYSGQAQGTYSGGRDGGGEHTGASVRGGVEGAGTGRSVTREGGFE